MVLILAPCGNFTVCEGSPVIVVTLLGNAQLLLLAHPVAELLGFFQVMLAGVQQLAIPEAHRLHDEMGMDVVGVCMYRCQGHVVGIHGCQQL